MDIRQTMPPRVRSTSTSHQPVSSHIRISASYPVSPIPDVVRQAVEEMVPAPTKMLRCSANGWWWRQLGAVRIAHPPIFSQSHGHNPSPGDLFVHYVDANRFIWIRNLDNSWKALSPDAGTKTGRGSQADDVSHPVRKDLLLQFPWHGNPNWVTRQTVERKIRG